MSGCDARQSSSADNYEQPATGKNVARTRLAGGGQQQAHPTNHYRIQRRPQRRTVLHRKAQQCSQQQQAGDGRGRRYRIARPQTRGLGRRSEPDNGAAALTGGSKWCSGAPPAQAQQMTMQQQFWQPMQPMMQSMMQALQQPAGPYSTAISVLYGCAEPGL